MKNCSPWEGLTLERFVENCPLWEGPLSGGRGEVLPLLSKWQQCDKLTTTPFTALCATGKRRERIRNRVKPGQMGEMGQGIFKVYFSLPYPDMISKTAATELKENCNYTQLLAASLSCNTYTNTGPYPHLAVSSQHAKCIHLNKKSY